MRSLATIRSALATGLATCNTKRVHDKEPDAIAEWPCLIIGDPTGSYDDNFAHELTYVFPVALIMSRAADSKEAIGTIDPYIDPTVSTSVPAAVNAVQGAWVSRFSQYDASYVFGETTFAGVTFEVQVLSD